MRGCNLGQMLLRSLESPGVTVRESAASIQKRGPRAQRGLLPSECSIVPELVPELAPEGQLENPRRCHHVAQPTVAPGRQVTVGPIPSHVHRSDVIQVHEGPCGRSGQGPVMQRSLLGAGEGPGHLELAHQVLEYLGVTLGTTRALHQGALARQSVASVHEDALPRMEAPREVATEGREVVRVAAQIVLLDVPHGALG